MWLFILFCWLLASPALATRGSRPNRTNRPQIEALRAELEEVKTQRQVHIHVGGSVETHTGDDGHLHIHIEPSAEMLRTLQGGHASHHDSDHHHHAHCHITSASGITGCIDFHQQGNENLHIQAEMSGFDHAQGHRHELHVHEYGNLHDGCNSIGGHYNPHNKEHGDSSSEERHIGDLGNITCDSEGKVSDRLSDSVAKLEGPDSIIGRSIAIHSGNGEEILGCCVIGHATNDADSSSTGGEHGGHHGGGGHQGGGGHHGGHGDH